VIIVAGIFRNVAFFLHVRCVIAIADLVHNFFIPSGFVKERSILPYGNEMLAEQMIHDVAFECVTMLC
jgi:hypothetical protein